MSVTYDAELIANTKSSPEDKFICVVCQKPTLNLCSNCQEVFYCSSEHQALDWPTHRVTCLNSAKVIQSKEVLDKKSKLSLF